MKEVREEGRKEKVEEERKQRRKEGRDGKGRMEGVQKRGR